MAKLVAYTEMQFNGKDSIPSTGVSAAIAPKKVISMTDVASPAYCSIKYGRLDNSNPDNIHASGSAGALTTGMNAANTTDVHKIILPIIDQQTSKVTSTNIIVDSIHQVKVDKASAAFSYVWVEDATQTRLNMLHASTTVAAIVAAANA